MTEEEFDIAHHKKLTAQRNFDKVYYHKWLIKTWCVAFSPQMKQFITLGKGTFPPILSVNMKKQKVLGRLLEKYKACQKRRLAPIQGLWTCMLAA